MATDNFNRSNGAVGGAWTLDSVANDPMIIVSNEFQNTNYNSASIIYDTASTNQKSQITVSGGFVGQSGPMVNCDGSGNGYLYEVGGAVSRVDAGVRTPLQFGTGTTAGDVMRIERQGNDLVCYLNGVEDIRATSTTYTGGYNGIYSSSGGFRQMDDWTDTAGGGGGGAPWVPAYLQMLRSNQ
jgi:hypothetical protein